MKKQSLALLFSLLVAMQGFAVVTWDGTSSTAWTEGAGTAASPYILSSPNHLKYLQTQVNAGTTYAGKYFRQTQDFNLNSKTWTSIGTSSNKFAGNYDGNGKYISNLTSSIFGYINNAEIKNLTLQGANLTAQSTLVNTTAGTCRIINCHNKINVTASSASCGGLVLTAGGTSLEMRSCTNIGNFGSSTSGSPTIRLGGLIASSSAATLQVTSCCNTGQCSLTKQAYSSGTPTSYVGGLVGEISGSNVTIHQCYSIHNSVSSGIGYSAPLIGYISSSNGSIVIKSSYAKGDAKYYVYGYKSSSSVTVKIQGYYLIETYTSTYGTPVEFAGGIYSNCYIAGTFTSISNWVGDDCYYASTSGISTTNASALFVSTGAIKKAGFIPRINANADEEYFTMDYEGINDGYPILKWQAGTRYAINATCDANRGTVSGGGEYPMGYSATLKATPKSGCTFVGWSDGNTDNPRTVTVSGAATYIAQFTKTNYTIYVNQDCTSYME